MTRRLPDVVGQPQTPAVSGAPDLPTEFPELVANLARHMAEVWLEVLTSLASAPPSQSASRENGDYTAKELGKQLQMSESTIYKHWRAGAWPNAYMISKQKGLRIPRGDVAAWKAARTPAKAVWHANTKPSTASTRTVS